MPNLPYLWTLVFGLASLALAFWSPLWAWVPLLLREAYFGKLLHDLSRLDVKHIPQLSQQANELLRKHPGYYWEPAPGTMYRQAVSLSGVLGLALGVIGVFRGSWLSWGVAVANLAVMMALLPGSTPLTISQRNTKQRMKS